MPTYILLCPGCDQLLERFWSYDEFEEFKDGYPSICSVTNQTEMLRTTFVEPPPVHFKGYGFYKTDSRSADENYDWDHFDGSGSNPEIKAINRRIKSPKSSVPHEVQR